MHAFAHKPVFLCVSLCVRLCEWVCIGVCLCVYVCVYFCECMNVCISQCFCARVSVCQVMVLGDFNASVSEKVHGVVGPHGLECTSSDNGERLVSFACGNGLCLMNTYFGHKRIHQATWYPP